PEDFESSIIRWLEKLREKNGHHQRVIALDGKALRGFSWKVGEQKLHILNAWDCTEQKFAGQLSIDSKTNEISAAPKLLKKLHLEKTVITVDAMMTQTEIAAAIIDQGGEYFMALKGNQGGLFEDVQLYFSDVELGMSSWRTLEKNRGKVEVRKGTKAKASWIEQKKK
ncbi:MAG: ISAs1 family transposase, partial [Chlamydiota bacterium]